MQLDVLGLLGACSHALDCVESELVGVTGSHSKRVAYMSVCIAEELGISGEALCDLAACALLHDNALTQYIQEELELGADPLSAVGESRRLGVHCLMGEENISGLPFLTDVRNVILLHHENADGSGPFGRKSGETPVFARIIHLSDLLDAFCRAESFTPDVWNRAQSFLLSACPRICDGECVGAFRRAFPMEHFLTLGSGVERRLREKAPHTRRELSFSQIRSIADFFAGIVDYKSPFTSTHSIGVAARAEGLSRFMSLGEDTAEKMYLAGALHDIGKVAITGDILEKPGKLTDSEFSEMRRHAKYTWDMLSEVEGFGEMRCWAAFHHERLDGSGYPFGLTAEELDIPSRIMACADIYQALTENRPYKSGMSHEEACSILRGMAGRGWLDAGIVENACVCFGRS